WICFAFLPQAPTLIIAYDGFLTFSPIMTSPLPSFGFIKKYSIKNAFSSPVFLFLAVKLCHHQSYPFLASGPFNLYIFLFKSLLFIIKPHIIRFFLKLSKLSIIN